MSGSFTDYLEEKVLSHVLNIAYYTPPAKVYLGLGNFTEAQGGEITGAGYERQRIRFTVPTTDTSGNTFIDNKCDLYFGPAEEDWPTFTHAGIFDAKSGGNLLGYCAFPDMFSVKEDEQFYILASEVTMVMSEGTIQVGRWSKYLQEKILSHVFLNDAFPQPTLYAGITKSIPAFDATGTGLTEPSAADGYQRAQPVFSTPAQFLLGYAASYNWVPTSFGTALRDWFSPPSPPLQQIGLVYCDQSSGGNLLFIAKTSISLTILAGDTVILHDAEDYNQVGVH